MNDYINREEVIEMLWDLVELENAYEMKKQAVEIVQNWEPSDVRENVKGEWIDTTSGEHYKCSHCGALAPIWIDESNSCEYDKDISEWLSDFCPNCGADMRGES